MADQTDALKFIADSLANPKILTIGHNMIFDLPVLESMGIRPANWVDTMIMAYLLQDENQGLKPLAYRHCGMHMESYSESIAAYSRMKALSYLHQVVEMDWPNPDPVMVREKGVFRTKQPQNIKRKAKRILDDLIKDADPRKRWEGIGVDEGRGQVEMVLGPMPEADLTNLQKEDAIHYACRDADATLRVYNCLRPRIETFDLQPALAMDQSIVPMVLDMMKAGFPVDVPYLKKLGDEFNSMAHRKETEANAITGYDFDCGSHPQVADILYNRLKLPKIAKTPSGQGATGERILAQLTDRHPVVQVIRDYRMYSKLYNTYAREIPKYAKEDRVHCQIQITRTATGRLATKSPNLMAQPTRTEEGKKIRGGFTASPGCQLLSTDFSQIELRVLGHESQDDTMLKIFREGGDIHANTASRMFGIPEQDLDKMKHRYPAKRTNFGIVYGITAQGLLMDFNSAGAKGWTLDKCQELIETWFDIYPGVRTYMDGVHQHARQKGYVRDMFGRVRWIPGVKAAKERTREEALRMGGNMPIQSGAQGVIKTAMAKLIPVYRHFRSQGYVFNPLLQVHDDLIFEVEESILSTVVPLVASTMEFAVKLSIPTPVDPEIGPRWNEMEAWNV